MNRPIEPKRRRPARARLGLLIVVASGLAVASPAARGDNIDEQLAKEAPKVAGYLRENKLTTVGVLRFRVKKGAAPRTLSAGPMNTNMASRLENVLAVADSESGHFRLIADPGATIASQRERLTYLDAKGRAALFSLPYRAVGGDAPARPDAFLFGDVALSDDYLKTAVTLYAFTLSRLTPEVVTAFTVPTDRSILVDIGENFIIARRGQGEPSGSGPAEAPDRDHLAARSVTPNKGLKSDGGKVPDPDPHPNTPAEFKDLLDFKLVVEGKEQPIRFNKAKDEWQADAPGSGQSVEMVLKNVSGKRLGVVLTVNGVNTILGQEGSIRDLPKFILDAKEEYRIKGFIQGDGRVAPFSVTDSNELSDEVLGSLNVGMIQLAVFDQEPEKEIEYAARRVSSPELRMRPRSMKDVRARSNLTRGANGLIQADNSRPIDAPIKEVDFPHASQVALRSIRYLEIRPAGQGVKAKEEEQKPGDKAEKASHEKDHGSEAKKPGDKAG